MNWFLLWLFLHILAAIIAFGPLFVFPIVGTMAAQAPQNMRFATELNHRISTCLVVPLALTMVVSGSGLIWTADINFFRTGFLIVAVALYLVAVIISIFVLVPLTKQMLAIAENAPAPPIAGGSIPRPGPGIGAPHADVRRLRNGSLPRDHLSHDHSAWRDCGQVDTGGAPGPTSWQLHSGQDAAQAR